MKKRKLNKSTLLLAFLAVVCWCFYFCQEKENEKIIYETQAFVSEAVRKTEELDEKQNKLFLGKTENSFNDSIHYVKRSFNDSAQYRFSSGDLKYKEDYFKDKIYNSVPFVYFSYIESISNFEHEFFFRKKWNKDFEYDKQKRKNFLQKIENNLKELKVQSTIFGQTEFQSINWNETNDIAIWLDLVKQREQIINLKDSILVENKKQFPTSYTSDNFEGYSTLIPNYETQTMLIKAYWFPSETKFYGFLFDKETVYPFSEEQRTSFFKFNDSVYWEMKTSITYHVFDKLGDTLLFPIFNKERLSKMGKDERQNYEIPFKVVSDKQK